MTVKSDQSEYEQWLHSFPSTNFSKIILGDLHLLDETSLPGNFLATGEIGVSSLCFGNIHMYRWMMLIMANKTSFLGGAIFYIMWRKAVEATFLASYKFFLLNGIFRLIFIAMQEKWALLQSGHFGESHGITSCDLTVEKVSSLGLA